MPDIPFAWLPLLLLVGLLPGRLHQARLAVAGCLLAGLAAASATIVLGSGTASELAQRIAERNVLPSYLVTNAAILFAGCGLAATALAGDWREGRPVGSALLALALTAFVIAAWPLLGAVRPLVALLGAMAAVMVLLAWATWSGRRGVEPMTPVTLWLDARTPATRASLLALYALAALWPNLGLALVLTATLLLLLYVMAPRRASRDRWPVAPLAAVLALAAAWLAWRAAGPDGLGLRSLADAAFSPALQTVLGALLLPVVLMLAGVPPFDRFVPGAALAPVAAGLLVRGVLPALPDGVEHWRSAVALWLVLGAADAIRRRRDPLIVSCAAMFVLLVADERARAAGAALAVVAALIDVVPAPGKPVPEWLARVALAAAAVAWSLALPATLAAEVVYSVAMVTVGVAGLLRGAGRPAER